MLYPRLAQVTWVYNRAVIEYGVPLAARFEWHEAVWRVWRTTRDRMKITPAKKAATATKTKLARRKAKLRMKLAAHFRVSGNG
jgi:hypothetical protein